MAEGSREEDDSGATDYGRGINDGTGIDDGTGTDDLGIVAEITSSVRETHFFFNKLSI